METATYTKVLVVVFGVTKKKHKFLIVMKVINIMMNDIMALLLDAGLGRGIYTGMSLGDLVASS